MKQEPEKEPIKSKRTFGDALWVIGLLLAVVFWGVILIDAMKGYQEEEARHLRYQWELESIADDYDRRQSEKSIYTVPATTPAKSATPKTETAKPSAKKTSKKQDTYDVYDYSDAEDFAEDRYEEFYDYEDDYEDEDEAYDAALDYWYDHHEE